METRIAPAIAVLLTVGGLVHACGGGSERRQPSLTPEVERVTADMQRLAPGETTRVQVEVAGVPGPLSYDWSVGDPKWSVSGSGASAELTAPEVYSSRTTVEVEVTGEPGASASGSLPVETESNRLPRITDVTVSPNPVEPGETVALDVEASDPDDDELTYTWSAPADWTLASTEGPSVEVAAPNQPGSTAEIAVVVDDGHQGRAERTALVRTLEDRPPRITSMSVTPPQIAPGDSAQARVSAIDPDGGELTYDWSAPNAWSIDGTGKSVQVTAPERYGATAQLSVEVVDDGGRTVSGGVGIATTTNNGPKIQTVTASPPRVDRNGGIDLRIDATDPNGDPLDYSWSVDTNGWTLKPNGDTAELTASDRPGESARVSVDVSDPGGLSVGASVVVSTRANQPPRLAAIDSSPPILKPGQTTTLRADASDPEDDGLTYTWKAPGNWSLRGSGETVRLTAPNTYGDRATVRLTVEDAFGGRAIGSVTVQTGRNLAPTIASITAKPPSVDKKGTSTLSVRASDPNGDDLSYTWTIPQDWTRTQNSEDTIQVRAPDRLNVRSRFDVDVSDGNGASTTGSVVVQTRRNDPPTIRDLSASPNPITGGATTTATVDATDPENDPISYDWNLPGGWTGSSNDETIDVKAPTKRSVSGALEVEVSDGRGTTTEKIVLETKDNLPPTISKIDVNPDPILQNGTASASVSASDPDGDSLDYRWRVRDNSWNINGSGVSVGLDAPDKGNAGTQLGVEVTDGKGGRATLTASVATRACPASKGNCDGRLQNGCEVDLQTDSGHCGTCSNACSSRQACASGSCRAGVRAFGQFRKSMSCKDFKRFDNQYRRHCFQLNGQWHCTGNSTASAKATCTDTNRGIAFEFAWSRTWPMRFNRNTDVCRNYDPNHIDNLGKALGYRNADIIKTKPGNSCHRAWLDSKGTYQTAGGNSSQNQIYEVEFFN